MYIVNYHNVVARPLDALDRRSLRIPLDQFRREMRHLRDRFHPVALEALLDMARQGRVDARAVAITFDDGYLGVSRYGWPAMQELGLRAAMFVVSETLAADPAVLRRDDELEMAFRLTTIPVLRVSSFGYPDQPLTTPDERMRAMKAVKGVLKSLSDGLRQRSHQALLERLGVTPEDCRRAAGDEKYRLVNVDDLSRLVAAGWTVGSHTRTHRTLSALGDADVRSELVESRRDLMRLLGVDVTLLAYPYGGPRHVGRVAPRIAAESGYRYAMTAEPGTVGPRTDWFLVPRVSFEELVAMAGN